MGRTIVLVLAVALLAFAAGAAWPALQALWQADPTPQTQPLVTHNAAPSQPQYSLVRHVPAAVPRGSAMAAQPPAQQQNPAVKPPRLVADLSLGGNMAVASWDERKVRYAKDNITLRNRPGGSGLRTGGINRAPLTIGIGTRVLPVKEQSGWVLVSSPSSMLGWVEQDLLSSTPIPKRKKAETPL